MILPQIPREIALAVWERLLFEPYLWGGDDPLAGFDCSGLVIEGLKSAGRLPREGDWSAEALASRFPAVPAEGLHAGCLLFWNRGTPPHIGHVEIVWAVLGDQVFTIGASGGDSRTTSLPAAIAGNSYVKIRPAVAGWVRAVDPFA